MKSYKLFLYFIVMILLLKSSTVQSEITPSIEINIFDAYYDDLDNDGNQDDVRVMIMMNISSGISQHDVSLHVGLVFPSSNELWFNFNLSVSKVNINASYILTVDLYNSALETGWYWAHSYALMDSNVLSNTSSLYFDPPGSDDGDPVGSVIVTPTGP